MDAKKYVVIISLHNPKQQIVVGGFRSLSNAWGFRNWVLYVMDGNTNRSVEVKEFTDGDYDYPYWYYKAHYEDILSKH